MKQILVPTVTLFIICLVMTGLLALTNQVTAPIISDLETQAQEQAKQAVLPQAERFGEEQTLQKGDATYSYFVGSTADGGVAGVVFITVAKGYGGDIRMMTGVDTKGAVTGVQTLAINETPGLGMKAQDASFLQQFLQKTAGISVQTGPAGANEIQAITGATITSNAVTQAVNLALELFEALD